MEKMETKILNRIDMKTYLKYIVFSAALLTACDDPFEGDTFVTPTDVESEMTCTTLLENRSDDFSSWLELLKYADYYNGLKDAAAVATVFAPTNEAIAEFLEWKGVSSIQDLDKDYAREVVQNHIINGTKINSETFINAAVSGQPLSVQTLFLAYLRPTFGYIERDVDDQFRTGDTLNITSIYVNNQAIVQPRDSGGINSIEASNAIIYYMDDVIHPLSETMVDKLEAEGEYGIFAAACRKSGYDEVVSRLRDTIRIQGGGYTVTTYSFTCFAPSDEAMRAAGIQSVADLEALLPDTLTLRDYCAYHFINGQSLTKDQFFSFDSDDETLIYDTDLSGQVLTGMNEFSSDGSQVVGVLLNEKAHIIRSDIEARNGMIHKIDYYLPVWEPAPVTVRWDFCNSADIIAFVNGYGAAKSLGTLYSSALTNKEYQIDLSENFRDGQFGELSSFTYQANAAKASYASYRAVGFKKCKYVSTSKKTQNAYDAYLNNLLVLNLGYAGWIQFTTPTIIKGKYKVTLHYASEASLKSFHSAGSLTKFQIDPELGNAEWTKNAYVFKGLPTGSYTFGNGSVELWSELEFPSSGTHQFKATMLDINAKTNGSYHQLWDYLLLEPITE